MPDIAELTLIVNSNQAQQATQILQQLAQASVGAQNATIKMSESHSQANSVWGASTATLSSLIAMATRLAGIYGTIATIRQTMSDIGTEQRVTAGLTSLTGSASKANDTIEKLRGFATGSQFNLPGLEEDARLMTALGFGANQAVPALIAVAQYLQATGASSESLTPVVQSLVRMNDEGQISVFTLRQMELQGIQAGQMLANAFGKTVPEVMTMARNGTIDAHIALQLLIAEMAKGAQSTQGLQTNLYALYNTLFNNVRVALMSVGEIILRTFNVSGGLSETLNFFQRLNAELTDMITYMEGGQPQFEGTQRLVASIGVILRDIAAVIAVILAYQLLSVVAGLVGGFSNLVVVLGVLIGLDLATWAYKNNDAFRTLVDTLHEALDLLGVMVKTIGTNLGDVLGAIWTGGKTGTNLTGNYNQAQTDIDNILTKYNRSAGLANSVGNYSRQAGGGSVGVQSPWQQILANAQQGADSMTGMIGPFLKSMLDLGGNALPKIDYASQVQGVLKQLNNPDSASAFGGGPDVAKIGQMIDKLNEEASTLGLLNDQRQKANGIMQVQSLLQKADLENTQQGTDLLNQYSAAFDRLNSLKEINTVAQGLGEAFSKAFADFVTGAKNASQAARAFGQMILQLASREFIEKPLTSLISSGTTSLFANTLFASPTPQLSLSDVPSLAPGVASATQTLIGSALGNLFLGGRIFPFAGGGIVGGPTVFPMANGWGLMGEAGPEAVMPLVRGPGGKLGVESSGNSTSTNIVNMNVYANDAGSFRTSKRQINAQLQGMLR